MILFFQLLILAAVWGASFLFMRISSPEFGPIALVFVRTLVAALVLLPFIFIQKQQRYIMRYWRPFFLVGAISTALPFCLFAYTSLYLPAGYTSILNAMTPIFSAVVAFYWLHERLESMGIFGLVLGFLGVYVLSAYQTDDRISGGIWPVLSALGATMLYAVSSSYIKLNMSHLKPITVAAGSQLFSAFILLPFAYFYWPETTPSLKSWGSAVCMGIFSTALALLIFFRLLQSVGVTKTVSVTYLIPIFGVLWGSLFLDEIITTVMIAGGFLVLLGVGFTTGVLKSVNVFGQGSKQ